MKITQWIKGALASSTASPAPLPFREGRPDPLPQPGPVLQLGRPAASPYEYADRHATAAAMRKGKGFRLPRQEPSTKRREAKERARLNLVEAVLLQNAKGMG